MVELPFLDTCIFLLSLNEGDAAHKNCRALLDIERIKWPVCLSAITRAEATISEYLDTLEVRCAVQGIDWIEVPMEKVKQVAKKYQALKKSLEKCGMQSRDIKQVFAASCASACLFVTRDLDFWDPVLKGGGGGRTRVEAALMEAMSLKVVAPAAAIKRLC
jgi:hypothetical protein